MGFLQLLPPLDAVKALVGRGAVQPAKPFVVGAELQKIEQWQNGGERFGRVKAGIEAGFQAARPDTPERALLLAKVLTLTHQADAGDQPGIAADERVEIGQQRPAGILLQIRRVAAVAAETAVGN